MDSFSPGSLHCCRWSLCIAIVLLFRATAFSQTPTPVLAPKVIIDFMHMTDADRAAVMTALADISSQSSWPTITVKKGDSLLRLAKKYYAFWDSKYPATGAAIAKTIEEANDVKQAMIYEGQELIIPPLPQKPYGTGATSDAVQLWDPTAPTAPKPLPAFITNSVASGSTTARNPRLGTTIAFNPTQPETLRRFFERLSAPIRNRLIQAKTIYVGPTLETAEINLLNTNDCTLIAPRTIAALPQDNVRQLLGSISPTHIGTYYVLDVFTPPPGQECSHGNMVRDVILQTLASFGAPEAFQTKIEKIDLDYFSNPARARPMLEAFARSFSPEIEKQVLRIISTLEKQKPKSPGLRVPLLYLAAIYYKAVTDPQASVVSSSFWTRYDGFNWLPPEYQETSAPVLLGAVMNDANSYVENSVYTKTEPLRTLYDRRLAYGVILVGSEEEPGKLAGMTSQGGNGVTVAGKGANWGRGCLEKEKGTSLATPHVATLLWLAQAYWRSQKIHVDAREARLRLLLASQIDPSYVGKLASAGLPILERMLTSSRQFGVNHTGAVRPLKILVGANITIEVENQLVKLALVRNQPANELLPAFCALQVSGNEVFVFSEINNRWLKVNLKEIALSVEVDDRTITIDNIEVFRQLFQGVMIV